jgi:hypothetical protein
VIKQTQQSEQVLGLSSVMTICELPPSPGPIVPSNADGTHGNPIPISDSPDLPKPSNNVLTTSIDRLLGSCDQDDSSPTTYRWLDDDTIECIMWTF